jgi:hypothetical protein
LNAPLDNRPKIAPKYTRLRVSNVPKADPTDTKKRLPK